ncbi:MAG: hypothetical protein HY892_14985 [Deltaproteobacteria bacterium]|nr:hypothetical protein [Deltaproteobacteria bacterium]
MEICAVSRSLPAVLAFGLFLWVLLMPGETAAGSPVLGGPCAYQRYPGRARILSITPVTPPGETGTVFEVRYSFHPEEKNRETFAQTEGRTFLLTLKNGTYPSQKFLDKYRIEKGRVFDCSLQVITKGTCTPTLFEFTGIDLGDYGTR